MFSSRGLLQDLHVRQLVPFYPGWSDPKACLEQFWRSGELGERAVCEQLDGGLKGREPERCLWTKVWLLPSSV